MRLYAGSLTEFQLEVRTNNIAKRLEKAFIAAYRYKPSPNEFDSWNESLRHFSDCLTEAQLRDNGIVLELQLPRTSRRLDALVTGVGESEQANAVVVELKQWHRCDTSDAEDMVTSWVNGALRELLHPSVQAALYRDYLADMNSAFHEGTPPIEISACAYLHNYRPITGDPLLDPKFKFVVERVPFFGAHDKSGMAAFLHQRLHHGRGMQILEQIESAEIRPSKKLLEHVAAVVNGEPRFVLLDEQKVVFERTLVEARKGLVSSRKSILLVRGGPGTGKSVLAANLLGRLAKEGLDVQYATGSKAFTESMRSIVGKRAASQFTYFNNYTDADSNSVPVLVCDEAHRIREKSANQYTPKSKKDALPPQVDEIINVAKVSVFFIDDRQIVRPGEVGSADLIREKATQFGAEFREFELEAQFRCEGSDGFVNWVDNTLAIRPTANQIWESTKDTFDFRIFTTVEDLDQAIRKKAETGASARMVAGFCWKWSNPTSEGDLVEDVKIGNFERPWNAKPDAKKLKKGIPKSVHWAIKPEGLNQVGCVYTAQGFEFDYVGVIWGRDLVFSPAEQCWKGNPDKSQDTVVKRGGAKFVDFVKNTYRVLLSRGMKGCYVYCEDQETAKFLISRTEGLQFEPRLSFRPPKPSELIRLVESDRRLYQNCLPVYDLTVSAGSFGEFQVPDVEDVDWVSLPDGFKASTNMFIAKVVGESMNRVIPSGSWCIFRLNPAGTREGKIVLAQLRNFTDPEEGGAYTVKRYHSDSTPGAGLKNRSSKQAANKRIFLTPESTQDVFKAIEVRPDDDHVRIIAEFVRVI